MNALAFLRRSAEADGITETLIDDLNTRLDAFTVAPVPSILDRTASTINTVLHDARANEARLVNEAARVAEELRQTRLVISAFEPALVKLDDGYDAGDDGRKSYEAAIEAKRKKAKKPAEVTA